jgi:hypothetical protein
MQFRWLWCVVPYCMSLSHTRFLGVDKVGPCGFIMVYEHSRTQPPSLEVHCVATMQDIVRLPNGS